MTTLSRRRWRQAILIALEAADPPRARWLQEHPLQVEILNSLTTDVIDAWIEATNERENPPPEPSGAMLTTSQELASTVIARTLETPELWPDLEERFPRTHPPTKVDPIPLHLLPPTGPTRPR